MAATSQEFEELRQNQERLVKGLQVVSEMVESIYEKMNSGGLDSQERFQRDQQKS